MPGSTAEPRAELSEISAGVARLFAERLGRGPRKTRALWADGDVIVVLLEIDFTRAEQTLRGAGREADVVIARRMLQELLEPELVAIVQAATGRTVRAVLSAARTAPELSAEVFALEPLRA
ncbi:MAG TPA: Na-translocating system protein MpsC family protein [Baekduia sp.]|nr:Na-translocating system protein MpsC family protein [Baekduia sp.]